LRGTLPVGRVLGIPILLNVSWFASFFLVVGLLALRVFPQTYPGLGTSESWILGVAGGLAFFISIVLHELGHCVVARRYGIPVRNITLFIFGGVSQITQEAPKASAEFLMAFAGPAVSFVLGGLFVLAAAFIVQGDGPASGLVWWLGGINLVLGVFNLLPGFPMDGGRLLRSTIWAISGNLRLATRLAAFLGRVMAFALMGAGLITLLSVPGWPLNADPIEGLWLIFIGLFLNRAAGQTQQQARLINFLRSYRADQVMEPNVPTVPADADLQTLLAGLPPMLQDDVACFVERDGHVVGLIPRDRLQRVPRDSWWSQTADTLMIPADRITPAKPEDTAETLLHRMDAEGLPGLPVVSDGTVSGLVTRAGLFRAMRSNPRLRLLRL
jgi:Zn-dependent protease/predicted transcriptional regulator